MSFITISIQHCKEDQIRRQEKENISLPHWKERIKLLLVTDDMTFTRKILWVLQKKTELKSDFNRLQNMRPTYKNQLSFVILLTTNGR